MESVAKREAEIAALTRALVGATGTRRVECLVLLARRLRDCGLWARQRAALEQARALDPDHPSVQHAWGLLRLREGDWAEGLAAYDAGRWRLDSFETIRRPFAFPEWAGEDLAGRRMLLWAEQGIGDQVMQARAIDRLRAMGARLTVEADPRLFPLLRPGREDVAFVPQTVPVHPDLAGRDFDSHGSMLSAWAHLEAPTDGARCLTPDAGLRAAYGRAWAGMPGGAERLNVGLSWRSRAGWRGAERSVDLPLLAPLTDNPALRFHALQYEAGDPTENARALGAPLYSDPQVDAMADLTRLAAQIAALDLVITIDNSTAHLAGALGVPCWVLVPRNCDWRWGTGGEKTALYPGMRLFRSDQVGSWASALLPLYEAAAALTPRSPSARG
ncbi:MAG: hypothetical protein ACU0CO_13065 [Shimia sp.]